MSRRLTCRAVVIPVKEYTYPWPLVESLDRGFGFTGRGGDLAEPPPHQDR